MGVRSARPQTLHLPGLLFLVVFYRKNQKRSRSHTNQLLYKSFQQQRFMADEQNTADTVDSANLSIRRSGKEKPTKAQSEVDPHIYQMDFPCVGICLIINNKNFLPQSGMSSRNGTEKDGAAVKKTFENLGYKIIEHNDLTRREMEEQLKKVSMEDHEKNASFVCVILSHGDEGEIYGTDGPVKFDLLTRYFKGNNCRKLLGKPKLFFIQACRGTDLDEGADVVDGAGDSTTHRIPVEADFLYAYATAPGFFAWRNSGEGSWFIQSLCEILNNHSDLELMQIMTRVNRRVAYDYESYNPRMRQLHQKKEIPCIVSMLTKEFYFTKDV
ncbi:hypothetical protein WMY93_009283 [Mugilogobius chulae]|uniref:Caspase-3 n=1 Tax=Mugilogobius chulae TaxID=88201 RepID=A0AAW0PBC0_9GOBI